MESLFLVHSAGCVQELNIRSKKLQMMVYTSTESENLVFSVESGDDNTFVTVDCDTKLY